MTTPDWNLTLETIVERARRSGATPAEAQAIHEAIKSHPAPDFVKGFDVEFGSDSTNSRAAWIWFLIEDDVKPSRAKISELNRFADRVRKDLLNKDLNVWPYVDFRAAA